MAIVKACNITNSPKNTGKQCDTAMVATAMLIAIQRGIEFDDTDLEDPVAWLDQLIHEHKAFPLFGLAAPIRTIQNESEGDQIVTLDDGLRVFLRYGLYNRTFETTSGGLCYASALQSFLNSGYDIIEIDQLGQMLARKNSNGTYSGIFADFLFAPSPILADFKTTPYKNRFSYSFSPVELVNNGIIFKDAQALLSSLGLLDTVFSQAAAATTTALKVSLETECAGEDLVAKLGTALNQTALYKVTNVATGATVVISGVTIVSGALNLAGTFSSAATYRVTGTSPAAWKGAGTSVVGYDGETSYVDITIP